jgi:hypothetical protein
MPPDIAFVPHRQFVQQARGQIADGISIAAESLSDSFEHVTHWHRRRRIAIA